MTVASEGDRLVGRKVPIHEVRRKNIFEAVILE